MNRFKSKSDYRDNLAYRMPSTPLLQLGKKPKKKKTGSYGASMKKAYSNTETYGIGWGH